MVGELRAEALHIEILPEFSDEPSHQETEPMAAEDLPQEFRKFIQEEAADGSIPAAIREEVLGYGTNLMAQISERRRTERCDAPQ
jgi:hypothetical protein